MNRRRRLRIRSEQPVTLSPEEVEGMRVAGQFAASILDEVEKMIAPGLNTQAIDDLVHEMTEAKGAVSAPYQYWPPGTRVPFPGHCCTSINHVVCHGIPSKDDVLREGDIINVDVTPRLDGFHGDTSRTFMVGSVDPETRRLVKDTYRALVIGIEQVKPGNTIGDIGHAIQTFAEERGHGVVRQFAGHGIGKVFHGPPSVVHYGNPGEGMVIRPGMTFTIEPMINIGDWRCTLLDDHWTVVTSDGTLSAQFEHTITVTETGVEVLTLPEGAEL